MTSPIFNSDASVTTLSIIISPDANSGFMESVCTANERYPKNVGTPEPLLVTYAVKLIKIAKSTTITSTTLITIPNTFDSLFSVFFFIP